MPARDATEWEALTSRHTPGFWRWTAFLALAIAGGFVGLAALFGDSMWA